MEGEDNQLMSISAIASVTPHSPAQKAGVLSGEHLVRINHHPILDVLDYKFYSYEANLLLELRHEDTTRQVHIRKEEGEDLGLDFETYLMDKARSCANDCVFCFVDQMPSGMRDTLYFKDDDARLSFLTGNYITMTNLSKREIQRIIDLRISPINVSVHATNPQVRYQMLKHPKAGECMNIMSQFAAGGITMNCQIVSCPGYNDGEELKRSLEELATLHPQVNSISVVPVGLTKYRENLPELQPYHQETATEVIQIVEAFAKKQEEECGTKLAWCSDEFYLIAKKDLPEDAYYEDYTQWENGVGMIRLFRTEFLLGFQTLREEDYEKAQDFIIATGTASGKNMTELVEMVIEKQNETGHPIFAAVYPIKNDFFGHTVTVSGLITGQDLIAQLKDKKRAAKLIISESMLRHGEEVFLDDVTLSQVEEALDLKVVPIPQDGYDLVEAIYDPHYTRGKKAQTPMTEEAYSYNPPK